jgi:hypothetical protein
LSGTQSYVEDVFCHTIRSKMFELKKNREVLFADTISKFLIKKYKV